MRIFFGTAASCAWSSQVVAFSKVVRAKLRDRKSTFPRDYLRVLVSEIRVCGKTSTISGSYERLLSVEGKKEERRGHG
jgi:hypothetical protein